MLKPTLASQLRWTRSQRSLPRPCTRLHLLWSRRSGAVRASGASPAADTTRDQDAIAGSSFGLLKDLRTIVADIPLTRTGVHCSRTRRGRSAVHLRILGVAPLLNSIALPFTYIQKPASIPPSRTLTQATRRRGPSFDAFGSTTTTIPASFGYTQVQIDTPLTQRSTALVAPKGALPRSQPCLAGEEYRSTDDKALCLGVPFWPKVTVKLRCLHTIL